MKSLMGSGRPWFIESFNNRPKPDFFGTSGGALWPNMMLWKVSLGFGKRPMDRILKHPLLKSLSGRIRWIGGKNSTKRHLLVEENGAPLSLAVSGANRHDSVFLNPLLKGRVVDPVGDTPQNLHLDAAYVGKEAFVEGNGFVPHIRPKGEEKKLIERYSSFKARRWVVELSHSWFNRFRKLIPRYEKNDLSYIALNSLAAAMIVLNKVMIIYR